ncbi:MAG: hypothetical protein ACRDKE_02545 [Solirubrobacterales bacterium]
MLARSTFASILVTAIVLTLSGSAMAAPTDLDPAFSGDGKMIDATLFSEQAIYSSEFQSDGKLVTVGSDNGSQRWLIMRFNTDGSLDTTFDGPTGTANGKILLDPSTSFDAAYDVSITGTDKIVVAGRVRNTVTGKTEFGAVRLESTGAYDATFNSGAIKQFEIDDAAAGQDAYVESVDVHAGKIYLGGYAYDGVGAGGADFAIAVLENDGDLDPTFDGDGTGLKSATALAYDYLTDIYVESDGKIVTLGTTGNPAATVNRVFVAIRWTTTGSPDATFGSVATPGKVYATAKNGYAFRGAPRAAGGYTLVGATDDAPNDCLVVQFDAAGQIDTDFSTDGYQTADFQGGRDTCTDVDEDASGNLLVVGETRDDANKGDAILARLTSTGSLDTTFDPDGKVVLNLTANDDKFWSVHTLASGKILASGYQGSMASTAALIAVFNGGSGGFTAPTRPADIALDNSFDGDGRVRTDLSAGREDIPNGMAIAADGSVVAVGTKEILYSNSPLTYVIDGVVAKYLSSGAPDSSFSGDGVATFGPLTLSSEEFYDATVLADGSVIAVGTYSGSGAGSDLLIAKFTPGGVLDTNFSGDGWATHHFGYIDIARTVHALSDGSFVLSGSAGSSGDPSMLVVKVDSDGELVAAYGTGGSTLIDFDLFAPEDALDSVLLSDGSIVVAGYAESSGVRSAAAAKLTPAGLPDAGFGTAGEETYDIGDADSQANGIAAQPDDKVVIAGTAKDGEESTDAFAARVDTGGSLDSTFSGDGVALVQFDVEDDKANDVVVDAASGEVTLGGSANYGADDDFAFARFDSGGGPVAGFDSDGHGSVEMADGIDRITQLDIDAQRRVVATGPVADDQALADFGLARLPGPPDVVPPAPPAPAPPLAMIAGVGTTKIASPRHNKTYTARIFTTLRGSASSTSSSDAITKVQIALRKRDSKECIWLTGSSGNFKKTKQTKGKCSTYRWVTASGTTSWSLKLKKKLSAAKYELRTRVTLASGAVESSFSTKTNKSLFELR